MAKKEFTLYGYPKTRTTRVRWWLEEVGIPYQFVKIDIEKDEHNSETFRKLSPLGRIPVLKHANLVLYDVLSICIYLEGAISDKKLYHPPRNSPQSALFYQWLSFTTIELDQAVARTYSFHRQRHIDQSSKNLEESRNNFNDRLKPYEEVLSNSKYLLGPHLSGADIYSASLLAFADTLNLISKNSPVRSWLNNMIKMPSYKRALSSTD